MTWLVLPVQSDKEGKTREHTRIPSDSIKDYRPFVSNDGIERTVFFFKDELKKKQLVSPVSTESVDRALGAIDLLKKHEQELVD
jgi:hypothetical protein